MKKSYTIVADDDYVVPEGPIETNPEYLNRVMADVFASYRRQHPDAKSIDEAITACRLQHNADHYPPATEAPAEAEA